MRHGNFTLKKLCKTNKNQQPKIQEKYQHIFNKQTTEQGSKNTITTKPTTHTIYTNECGMEI